jgi:hypothetical protein
MNALLHVCCGTCGNAMPFQYAPEAKAGKQILVKWQECVTEGCPNKGKRYEPSTVELRPVNG